MLNSRNNHRQYQYRKNEKRKYTIKKRNRKNANKYELIKLREDKGINIKNCKQWHNKPTSDKQIVEEN